MTQLNFPYQIKRTSRKGSVAIQIRDGQVRLLAPHRVPLRDLEAFLRSRAPWIHAQLQRPEANSRPNHQLDAGDSLLLLGQQHRIRHSTAEQPGIVHRKGELLLELPAAYQAGEKASQYRLHLMLDWYQRQAESYLPERLHNWEARLPYQSSALKIRYYKSRWGSCDHKRRITLNTRLMLAPPAVIDYVIIHELCHIREMNHSPAFWQEVARYCPQYKQRRGWLRSNRSDLWLGP